MRSNTPQRSVLFVPAANQSALDKTSKIDADWLIFDLEDSVSPDQKTTARNALTAKFESRDFGRSYSAIRCNPVGRAEFKSDLETIAACHPDAVLLPKVSSVSDLQNFCAVAKTIELDRDIACWFMIETASGIANLPELLQQAESMPWRLSTLMVGHNDIASETGISLTQDRLFILPWLMQIVLQAKAHDLQVLDSVWNRFKDIEGFKSEALQAKQMGFDGKALIHPSQVEPASAIFSPSEAEVKRATRIVELFSQPEHQQSNVVNMDGEMIEKLHFFQAKKLLAKAGLV